jgi:hypothetical protein
MIALTLRLGLVPTVFHHRLGAAVRTPHAVGPASLTNGLEALGIIDQCPNVQHLV